ncbi:hypothetical protein [Tardiphaga sp. 285_C5_N1_2]|uniref:hypothetical protein n=1 Tax=Tardiphaga sp. 285_C5_N1_2 TaxID=3240775 RepID=UPI003F8B5CC6
MSAAQRQKRRRQRCNAGLVRVEFWTDEANLSAMLTAGRRLDPNKADDGKAISEATRSLVEDLALLEVLPDRHA